ncbi:hypothetical protein ACMZOO_12810 [Catenovulum sp. SX2]|uniref:hypothetical protein n=1 Tax=Catenovulum sp. SX2 TaxID=3398614 RepID=UPI003F842F58
MVYQYEAEQVNYAGGAAFETEHAGFTGSAKSLPLYVDNQFQQTLTFSNGNGGRFYSN